MKIKILASMLAGALAMLPVTANAGWGGGGVGPYGDPITIYGWQNHTFEMVESGAEGSQIDRTMINSSKFITNNIFTQVASTWQSITSLIFTLF